MAIETRELFAETSTEASAVAWQNACEAGNMHDVGLAVGALAKTIAAGMNGLRCAILATVAQPAPSEAPVAQAPRTWVYYELLGHRDGVAISWEGEIAGRRGLWLEDLQEARGAEGHLGEKKPVLELSGVRVFYSNAAIFSIRPIDGAEAAAAEWRTRHGYNRNDDIPF